MREDVAEVQRRAAGARGHRELRRADFTDGHLDYALDLDTPIAIVDTVIPVDRLERATHVGFSEAFLGGRVTSHGHQVEAWWYGVEDQSVDFRPRLMHALDEQQRAKIVGDLRARYGDRLELRYSVDPSLIGGLIIRIGDQVLDNVHRCSFVHAARRRGCNARHRFARCLSQRGTDLRCFCRTPPRCFRTIALSPNGPTT